MAPGKKAKKKKKLSLRFHRGIYKEAAVKAAAADYAAFACFAVSREAAYTKVVITPKEAELPSCFAQEFSNRALLNSI
ncbi:MAG: HxsD-like protein [Elusimicrobia bacterium]|nr:HxsD-like protein [Elusimicrobiota bacterium]